MDDLIRRQDAIDALDCINGTEEVLRSLPSAQQWIPVTERLPEKGQTVIAFDKHRNKIYINTLSSDGVTWRKYTNNVTAWMPLPEPYKEEN